MALSGIMRKIDEFEQRLEELSKEPRSTGESLAPPTDHTKKIEDLEKQLLASLSPATDHTKKIEDIEKQFNERLASMPPAVDHTKKIEDLEKQFNERLMSLVPIDDLTKKVDDLEKAVDARIATEAPDHGKALDEKINSALTDLEKRIIDTLNELGQLSDFDHCETTEVVPDKKKQVSNNLSKKVATLEKIMANVKPA